MSPPSKTLLLGAGELGTAFLPSLLPIPSHSITLGIRSPAKYTHITASNPNLTLLSLDLGAPSPMLSDTFSAYDTIISCTGFGQDASSLLKLAEEVLAAGRLRQAAGKGRLWFFPWQWGVDYDVTGDVAGLMPLFGVQKRVRELLREGAVAAHVKWTIVSTGIFMSFLFEQFWGVVHREGGEEIKVRALRDWDHKVTVTDVDDIGKVVARILTGEVESENRIIYAAGDTVSYSQLADILQQTTQARVTREQWSIPHLKEELAQDPEDLIRKYRVVFAGDGVWWEKQHTANHKLGIPVIDVETYAKQLYGK